jgi:F0F1-type ATP synthase assembly protein I
MEGAGAGLGIFIQYMGQALPTLLIILAMVGIIVAVGFGIAYVIKGSMQKLHLR